MPTKVFWLEPRADSEISLRRYVADIEDRTQETCSVSRTTYHNAHTYLSPEESTVYLLDKQEPPHEDPRWPTHCPCGYAFRDTDHWQVFVRRLFQAPDGQCYTLQGAPPGAMWDASWYPEHYKHEDGLYLVVKLPNGHDWAVDGQASNCTRPGETHRCWVRHGDPRTGMLHVDKAGNTCSAGAGSILAGSYHGFLHHGYLSD